MDAITTIRLNSKRIPRKSIKPLNGIPLLNYALSTMSKVSEIDRIIIYAHDNLRMFIKPSLRGRITFIERPFYLDSDVATFNLIATNWMEYIESENVVFFTVTSPFVKPETVTEMIQTVESKAYDSAFLAMEIKNFCWFDDKSLNYKLDNVSKTQELKPIIEETSSLYIFSKPMFKTTGRRIGYKPYIKIVDRIEGLDIDYPVDFEMAEAIVAI